MNTATMEQTPNFRVLAIHGKAGSGKTALAEMLVSQPLPRTTRTVQRLRVSFAGPIKTLAEKLFGWDGDKATYRLPNGQLDLGKGRGLLIGIGNAMRATYPDVWANLAVEQITRRIWHQTDKGKALGVPTPFSLFVIDDLRLMNETAILRSNFGSDVRFVRLERADALSGINDKTEGGLDGFGEWSHDIDNNGTLEVLGHHAAAILDDAIPTT